MTVCIAALCENGNSCVLVSDQMTTAHIPMGYEFENEEVEKIVKLNDSVDVYALISGDVLFANEVIEAVRKEVDSQSITAIPAIVELFRKSYQNIRRSHITRNELEPRGLDIPAYYEGHKTILPQIVQMIDNAFRRYNPRVDFILAGKGESQCHLFTIVNPGDSICHNSLGFVSIGSGAPHAMYSIIESNYKKSMDTEAVKKLLLEAKSRSQVAPGVGTKTQVIVL